MANYEFEENSILAAHEIANTANAAAEANENYDPSKPLTPYAVGAVIKDLWKEKVQVIQRGKGKKTFYVNLSRKLGKVEKEDSLYNTIDSLKEVELPSGWQILDTSDEELTCVKIEPYRLNNCRQLTEFIVMKSRKGFNLKLKCHGCLIDLDKTLKTEALNLNLKEKMLLVLRFLSASNFCPGLILPDDESMCALVPHFTGTLEDLNEKDQYKRKVYYAVDCNVISAPGYICPGCCNLQKRHKIRKERMEKRKEKIKPNKNKRYLTKKEIVTQLHKEQEAKKNTARRESYWRKKFLFESREFEKEDHEDLCKLLETIDPVNVPVDMQCLLQQQKEIVEKTSKNAYRWHPKIIKLCLELYCKNPHVLEPLRKFIKLPSNRTIRYYKNQRDQTPGWNREILEWCFENAQSSKLREQDFWGGFVIDEMKIEENVELVVKNGKHRLMGFVELSSSHGDMLSLEGKTELAPASHVLQILFLSDCGFRFPVAQFPSADCTPSDLYFIFWEGVQMMLEYNFTIYWCILDGAECNRQFIKMHFPDSNAVEKGFLAFNMHTRGPMVFMVDCKHNFKKIRNNIEKSNVEVKPRCLIVKGKQILWSQFVAAGNFNFNQKFNSLSLNEKLTPHHFKLDPALRMRNHLAEQVLDRKMLYLMVAFQRHLSRDCGKREEANALDETIVLLKHTSKLISFFNDKQPVVSVNDQRLKQLHEFLEYLSKWNEELLSPKHYISEKLAFDIHAMVLGFEAIVRIKLQRFPDAVVKPWVINQDVIENHFCNVRACNGQNNNPTYRLQESTQNSIRYGQTTISNKCNAGRNN